MSPDPAVASNDPYYFFSNPFALSSQPRLKQSVFGFAGRTNSGNLGSTFAFGSGAPEPIFFDNYIIGGAYQRDFVQFNSGVLIGAEVGFADRFGHYSLCCDRVVHSNRVAHSAELWGGISFRHEGLALFDAIRISPGFVFGLSAISNPIGQEALHQFDHQGSANVLFYLGFDLAFALANSPNTELVIRLPPYDPYRSPVPCMDMECPPVRMMRDPFVMKSNYISYATRASWQQEVRAAVERSPDTIPLIGGLIETRM